MNGRLAPHHGARVVEGPIVRAMGRMRRATRLWPCLGAASKTALVRARSRAAAKAQRTEKWRVTLFERPFSAKTNADVGLISTSQPLMD